MLKYWHLLKSASRVRAEILIKTLLGLAISATYIAQAILMSRVIDGVFQRRAISDLMPSVLIVLLLIGARALLLWEIESYGKVLAARIKSKLRMDILNQVFALGPGYFNASRTGRVSSLILDGIESLEPFFVSYIPQVFTSLAAGGFIFIYLCGYDFTGSLILLLSMILCVAVPMLTVPITHGTVTSYWSGYSALTSQYIDTIQGITTLKTLNASADRGMELEKDATAFYRKSIHNTGISLSNSAIMLVLSGVVSSITVVIVASRASHGIVRAEAVTAFLLLAGEAARLMTELNRHWHSSFLGLSVADRLSELLAEKPTVANPVNPNRDGLDGTLPAVSFDHVSFRYPSGAQALDDVSFDIPSGATVAIVGQSGAGKSTIINLIQRFYDCASGAVRLNGVNIRDYALDYLREHTAVVYQDSFLFQGSVAENIRLGKPGAGDGEVIASAKAANAHGFITALPDGYDTVIGERGMTLSGGERQRIAIARAILSNAPLLILDEATSSVDAESEALIQQALASLIRRHTAIIIAHRLSTIQSADLILVMKDGKIVERGTHDALLARGGAYCELIRAQEDILQ